MSSTNTDETNEQQRIATPRRVAYSASETAQMLGVCEASIWRARSRGQLKAIKFGSRTLFTADSVRKLLEADR